jgi:hypothetical protein
MDDFLLSIFPLTAFKRAAGLRQNAARGDSRPCNMLRGVFVCY